MRSKTAKSARLIASALAAMILVGFSDWGLGQTQGRPDSVELRTGSSPIEAGANETRPDTDSRPDSATRPGAVANTGIGDAGQTDIPGKPGGEKPDGAGPGRGGRPDGFIRSVRDMRLKGAVPEDLRKMLDDLDIKSRDFADEQRQLREEFSRATSAMKRQILQEARQKAAQFLDEQRGRRKEIDQRIRELRRENDHLNELFNAAREARSDSKDDVRRGDD